MKEFEFTIKNELSQRKDKYYLLKELEGEPIRKDDIIKVAKSFNTFCDKPESGYIKFEDALFYWDIFQSIPSQAFNTGFYSSANVWAMFNQRMSYNQIQYKLEGKFKTYIRPILGLGFIIPEDKSM